MSNSTDFTSQNIRNAGLCILPPFFSMLFKRIELLESNQEFKNHECPGQFASTGVERIAGTELTGIAVSSVPNHLTYICRKEYICFFLLKIWRY